MAEEGSIVRPPPKILLIPSEVRVRIYRHCFENPIGRFTGPRNGGRARAHFKSYKSLMLACKQIYTESYRVYASSVQLIVKNARIPLGIRISLLKFIQYLEIVDKITLPVEVSGLPTLKTLKLSISREERGHLFSPTLKSEEQAQHALAGAHDDALKQQAKLCILRCPKPLVYKTAPSSAQIDGQHRNRLSKLSVDPSRTFKIIDQVHVQFSQLRFGNGLIEMQYGAVGMVLEFDIDTLETRGRTLFDSMSERRLKLLESCLDHWARRLQNAQAPKAGESAG